MTGKITRKLRKHKPSKNPSCCKKLLSTIISSLIISPMPDPRITINKVPGIIPKKVVIIYGTNRTPNNAGAMLTNQNGKIGKNLMKNK